jgi:hypothetical protein
MFFLGSHTEFVVKSLHKDNFSKQQIYASP